MSMFMSSWWCGVCVPGRCEFRHVCEQEIQGREKGRRRRKEKERESEWIITSKTRKSISYKYVRTNTKVTNPL